MQLRAIAEMSHTGETRSHEYISKPSSYSDGRVSSGYYRIRDTNNFSELISPIISPAITVINKGEDDNLCKRSPACEHAKTYAENSFELLRLDSTVDGRRSETPLSTHKTRFVGARGEGWGAAAGNFTRGGHWQATGFTAEHEGSLRDVQRSEIPRRGRTRKSRNYFLTRSARSVARCA